ncbi:putative kinesin-like calmodulin-binding protein-like, partial [Apostichopus japonicus]
KHETELQTKLKEVKLEEEKIKINFRNLENSERSFRAKKMDDLGKNYVAVVPKERSLVSIKRDDSGLTMKHSSGSYKLDHSFSIGATAREIYEKVNCYIENAIDGGDSLVVAFGTSRNNPQLCTMYGDTEWKSAILPLTYKKIFERANQLKTGKYAVKIRSRFVHVEDENDKETFILPKSTLVDTCKDPKAIPSIESKDENSIERLFLEHRESIMKGSSKQNCFVQFIINTEDENNTISTGTITLATLHAATVAKATLEKEAFKSPLEQYLSDIVHNANSRCLLLAHLNEDKDDIKEVLKVARTMTERKKSKQKGTHYSNSSFMGKSCYCVTYQLPRVQLTWFLRFG